MEYLVWGGFPKRIEFAAMDDQRRHLNDLDRTIVSNGIINRYHIRKTETFQKFVDFLLVSNARISSAKSISDTFRSNGTACSVNTVQKWIGYLAEAFVIDEVPKYSGKAKRKLAQSRKFHDCDVALNSIRIPNGRYDLSHNLENVVYNELVYRGCTVFVYDNRGREIAFLAEKDRKRYFEQVAYSVVDDKAYAREFSAFHGIDRNDRKILISTDTMDYSTSNVEHVPLDRFLAMDDLS